MYEDTSSYIIGSATENNGTNSNGDGGNTDILLAIILEPRVMALVTAIVVLVTAIINCFKAYVCSYYCNCMVRLLLFRCIDKGGNKGEQKQYSIVPLKKCL